MCNRINLHLILSLILCLSFGTTNAEKRYVGGDISLLPLYEEAGAKYKTHEGEPISDVLSFCKQEGMNAMRVRVFVNPEDYSGNDADPNACQTIESVLPLCKRIKDQGFDLVLDFMYSDTWADPAKQWTPKQWKNLNDEELCKAVHAYTKNSLTLLKDAGVIPDFIQTGNEISYGMLWGSNTDSESSLKKTFMGSDKNWKRLGDLLKNAIAACHEVCPDAKIILHTERVAAPNVQRNFYNQMKNLNVDYDIIGISYYPYFHGSLSKLETAINDLEANFKDKDIMVVETGYSYKWEVPGTSEKVDYPYSDEGQNQFAKDLVNMLLKHDQVIGLLWWWMEYNAFGTSLSGWYNAPLFDSQTGKATSALTTLCSFAKDNNSVNTIYKTNGSNIKWYDIQGNEVTGTTMNHGLFISSDGQKILK